MNTKNKMKKTKKASSISGQHIVVLDRGFIYVGNISLTVDAIGAWVCIEKARCIRIWGTTQGLGELRTGPTHKTVLDECGSVVAPLHAIIHMIPCSGF